MGNGNVPAIVQAESRVDPEIIALAAAFFSAGNGKITKEQAVKAAYYFQTTGHIEGRDDYLATEGKMAGKVVPGYRGILKDIDRDFQIKYRRPTAEEMSLHDISPKGKSLVCECYVLDTWRQCRNMGVTYEPILGIAYYPPGEKIQVPATKTEYWVLQKNARKDALRQVPGLAITTEEVIEEARERGISVEIPPGVNRDQAAMLVNEAARAQIEPPAEAITTDSQSDAEFENPPSTSSDKVWQTWRDRTAAFEWADAQSVYKNEHEMRRSWANLQSEKKLGDRQLFEHWYEKVLHKLADREAAASE